MTHTPQEPAEPKGPGCSLCVYLGWGPGFAVRCRHPERWCWSGPLLWPVLGAASPEAQFKVGCERKQPWGIGILARPLPVSLAAWCEDLAERKWFARRFLPGLLLWRAADAPDCGEEADPGLPGASGGAPVPGVPAGGPAGAPGDLGGGGLPLWRRRVPGESAGDVSPLAAAEDEAA